MIETGITVERAILIGLNYPGQDEREAEEYIDELSFLADTAGAEPVRRFIQKLDIPNPRTFVGSGKIEEIARYVTDNKIDIAIFDDELSPSQIRNIEKELGCRILDRTNLILDIFARRARTSHARTQVELAQYQYLLPRLAGMWTHLERQRGGIGLRGPGETEIETTIFFPPFGAIIPPIRSPSAALPCTENEVDLGCKPIMTVSCSSLTGSAKLYLPDGKYRALCAFIASFIACELVWPSLPEEIQTVFTFTHSLIGGNCGISEATLGAG